MSRKKHLDDTDESGGEMWHGIVCARAYSVVNTLEVKGVKLVRLSCMWDGSTPYKGPWSKGSPEWTANPEARACGGARALRRVLTAARPGRW